MSSTAYPPQEEAEVPHLRDADTMTAFSYTSNRSLSGTSVFGDTSVSSSPQPLPPPSKKENCRP
jgi:hypothetical protein